MFLRKLRSWWSSTSILSLRNLILKASVDLFIKASTKNYLFLPPEIYGLLMLEWCLSFTLKKTHKIIVGGWSLFSSLFKLIYIINFSARFEARLKKKTIFSVGHIMLLISMAFSTIHSVSIWFNLYFCAQILFFNVCVKINVSFEYTISQSDLSIQYPWKSLCCPFMCYSVSYFQFVCYNVYFFQIVCYIICKCYSASREETSMPFSWPLLFLYISFIKNKRKKNSLYRMLCLNLSY